MMLDGELSFATVPVQLARAEALLDGLAQAASGLKPAAASAPNPAPNFALSLARVPRADSAGLAFLLELTRRARARGLELRFTEAPAQIVELAHFFGLEPVLQFGP